MRLKSFHGNTLNEAMSLVREALGDNAIIVSTRDDDMGGVRVTAAIEDTPIAAPQSAAAEINPTQDSAGSEVIEIIATALLKHQVPASLAERLLATATQFANEDPVLALGAALDTHFVFQTFDEGTKTPPVMFVGPPGAGKTLCTAKIATKATLAKKKVSVLSTDLERAGAIEQLSAFTRLLQVNLIEIEDAHSLQDALNLQAGSDLIVIDTAGCNPFDNIEKQETQDRIRYVGSGAVIVLPADMDALEAIDMTNAFRQMGAERLLFTRLDMTRRLGCILRAAYETKTPLTYFSASHKVTAAPTAFNPITLARLVLPPQVSAEAKAIGIR